MSHLKLIKPATRTWSEKEMTNALLTWNYLDRLCQDRRASKQEIQETQDLKAEIAAQGWVFND